MDADTVAAIAEGEALMAQAPRETWNLEWVSLSGTGGEIERHQRLQASDEADPALAAYYETVTARYDAAVRVGIARKWLPADFKPSTAKENPPCPNPLPLVGPPPTA